MERSPESGKRWVLAPRPMRVAAILLGLWGTQTLVSGYFYGITLLPAPLDGPVVSLVVGLAAIAAAIGILRAEAWARALGLMVMAVWALELLVAIARSVTPPLDLASNWPAVASWAIGLTLFGFVVRELLSRWPSARPRNPGENRRTLAMLAVVLVPLFVRRWDRSATVGTSISRGRASPSRCRPTGRSRSSHRSAIQPGPSRARPGKRYEASPHRAGRPVPSPWPSRRVRHRATATMSGP